MNSLGQNLQRNMSQAARRLSINEHPSQQPAEPQHRGEPVGLFGDTGAERNRARHTDGRVCAMHFPKAYARDHARHRADR